MSKQAKILVSLDSEEIVRDILFFAEAFYGRVSSKWDLMQGACIASACITSDVFRRLGYEARPLPVIASMVNVNLLERHRSGDSEGIHHTHLVIGHPSDKEEVGRWKGHIVSLLRHPPTNTCFILDASLTQAQRDYLPHVPDLAALPFSPLKEYFGNRETDIFVAGADHRSGDTSLGFYLTTGPEADGWKMAPDAQPSRRKMTVNQIVRQVTRRKRDLSCSDIRSDIEEVQGKEAWQPVVAEEESAAS